MFGILFAGCGKGFQKAEWREGLAARPRPGWRLRRNLPVIRVDVIDQELAHVVLFFFVPGKEDDRSQSRVDPAGGKIVAALVQGLPDGGQIRNIVLDAHGRDGGIGPAVAIGMGIEQRQKEGAHFRLVIIGQTANVFLLDVWVLLGSQGLRFSVISGGIVESGEAPVTARRARASLWPVEARRASRLSSE